MTTKTAELGALLYVAGDNGITGSNLATLLEISNTALRELTTDLAKKLKNDENSGLQLVRINDEYKLTTSPDVGEVIENYFQKDLAKNLSQSALEILSIIAYRQPITRIEVDEIRGVNSAGALQTLVWRGLVKIDGKKEAPGHPNLYVTTEYFLQYFGYQSLADLPLIESFEDESFDAAGEVDLFSTKGQSDKNLAKIKKEEK